MSTRSRWSQAVRGALRRAACVGALALPACGQPLPPESPAHTDETAAPATTECLPLQAWFACQRASEDGTWEPVVGCAATMTTGDRFRLAFKAGEPAHVYVVVRSVEPDGGHTSALALAFPGPGEPSPLAAEVQVLVPEQDWLELDANGGVVEHVEVIASRTPLDALEALRGGGVQGDEARALAEELGSAGVGDALCAVPPRRTSLDPILVLGADGEIALEPAATPASGALGLGIAIEHH